LSHIKETKTVTVDIVRLRNICTLTLTTGVNVANGFSADPY